MRKFSIVTGLATVATSAMLFPAIALGQTTTAVVANTAASSSVAIPIGQWVGDFSTLAMPLIAAAVVWVFRKLPGSIQTVLKTAQVDQLLTMALDYGFNAAAGATKGKVISVAVGNQVVAEALNYVLAHGPATLINWMGGETAITQKLLARLTLAPDAQIVAAPGGTVAIATAPGVVQTASLMQPAVSASNPFTLPNTTGIMAPVSSVATSVIG